MSITVQCKSITVQCVSITVRLYCSLFNPEGVSLINPEGVSLINPEGVSLFNPEGVTRIYPVGVSMICVANTGRPTNQKPDFRYYSQYSKQADRPVRRFWQTGYERSINTV